MPEKSKEGRDSASLTACSSYIYYYFISGNSVLKENSIQDWPNILRAAAVFSATKLLHLLLDLRQTTLLILV